MVFAIDWNSAEKKLIAFTKETVHKFSEEHPDETVCAIYFDSEPRYGYVIIAFDTPENNLKNVRETEDFRVSSMKSHFEENDVWDGSTHGVLHPILDTMEQNPGDFTYYQYAQVDFQDWENAADEVEDDEEKFDAFVNQLNDNFRILACKVIHELVEENAFAKLNLFAPSIMGYGIHDEEEAIVRFLRHRSIEDA